MQITVKAARVNSGLSQLEVAEHLNLSLTGYRKKENGKSSFYAHEIVMLSDLFNIPLQNFFEVSCHKKTRKEQGSPSITRS